MLSKPGGPLSLSPSSSANRSHLAADGSPLGSFGRVCFSGYLLLALLYTFWHTLAQPAFSSVFSSRIPLLRSQQGPGELAAYQAINLAQRSGQPVAATSGVKNQVSANTPRRFIDSATGQSMQSLQPVAWKEYGKMYGVEWDVDILHWQSSFHSQDPSLPMSEDFFLSKAFGESLQPSKVIPYYYRATSIQHKKDITITTLVTSNRFRILAQLADKYKGEYRMINECPAMI